MSDDVSRLLSQLGQPELEYREFTEKGETPSYWPIFRLVNGHPALSHLPGARRRSIPTDPAAAAQPTAETWTGNERRVGGPGTLFRRYADHPAPTEAKPDESSNDIRGLLRRLSE